MKKLDYEQIMDIQENATRKLLNYIDSFFQKEMNIKTIEFYYPDFDETRTNTAFNVWISLDYMTKYGKNFIELFLEDNSNNLSNLEKEILSERNKSHISLFEIKNIKGDLMYVKDLLCNKHHIVWEPELSKIVDKSELIFGRISKVIIYEKFIGDLSFLPDFSKSIFLEKVFSNYDSIKDKEDNISMKYYLRKYSLNMYKIYTDCVYDVLGFDDEDELQLAEELGEFESFLKKSLSESTVEKHIKNLINIYEYFLYDIDYTLYDLNKINLNELIEKGIFDNFISSKSKLNSYIATLKKYIKFLNNEKDEEKYRETYEEILKISKKREMYFKPKKPIDMPLYWNKSLDKPIKDNLNKKSILFLNSYEKYLFYIRNNNVGISKPEGFIKSKYLLELNNIITQNMIAKMSKNIVQSDLPLIHLFYKFSLSHYILTINNNKIIPYEKENQYISLKEYEKLALFIDYVWNALLWNEFANCSYENTEQKYKYKIIESLNLLTPDTIYDYTEIKYNEIDTPIFDKNIIHIFDYMGLLIFKEASYFEKDSISTISITNLGKAVFNILKESKSRGIENKGKIVDLNKWKETNS
ncbi:hypothetical protein [Anaerosalibacter massiliensis]|uniref:Uncharacterized protein n=1 Tax=Anaerosalibacter massiliensis TaxID=1347392 RepID=A0A9X2MPJ3_9FIRM|nr:hypothetical protein [Anaerosalibacter massiliensis]MCR2044766.1 hypothetical protein [Anaerosalibacter massiliensis]